MSSSRSKIGRNINPRKVVSPDYGSMDPEAKTRAKVVVDKLDEVSELILTQFEDLKDLFELQQSQIKSLEQRLQSVTDRSNSAEKHLDAKLAKMEKVIVDKLTKVQESVNYSTAQKEPQSEDKERKGWFK